MTSSGAGRLLRLTVEIPTDVGPLGVTVVEVKRSAHAAVEAGPKFFIADVDDCSFAAQYASYFAYASGPDTRNFISRLLLFKDIY